ncbi:unnamed protein product, partial [Ilex paraguariensis]
MSRGDKKEEDGEEVSNKPPIYKEEGECVKAAIKELTVLTEEIVGDTTDLVEEDKGVEVPKEATTDADLSKQIEKT